MKTNKKNIRIGAIVALVLLSFMTLSQITSVQALGAVVSGEVTCGSTAVNNALVSLIVYDVVEDTDYTDANGDYFVMLRDLLTSTIPCTIKVEKSGYTTIYRDTYLYPSTPTDFDIEWEVTQTCNGYVYDHVGDAISGATVKLIKMSNSAVLGSDNTDVNGEYSFSVDVQENLYCKIQVEKTNYETQYFTIYCIDQTTSANFRTADTTVNKIAAFFYATDLITTAVAESYGDQLDDEEGFDTILYFEDEEDWEDGIDDIDGYESADDFVFIYIAGHGAYNEEEDNSRLRIDPSTNTLIYSDELASCLNTLESDNIFILIFSCEAGGFEDDLKNSGRFVITESDCDTVAYLMDPYPDESVFSYYFFYRLKCGDSDTSAYNSARSLTTQFYEDNYEPYWWLDHGPQYPMKNDQISYTWFEWW